MLDGEIEDGRLTLDQIGDNDCLFLPEMHEAEEDIAAALIERAWQAPPWRIKDIEKAVASAEAALAWSSRKNSESASPRL